jgi:hypothetical protein
MAAQFCSTCGSPAVAGDRFCRKCGETLYEATMDLPREVARGGMEEMAPQAGVAAYPPSGQFGYSPAPQAGYGYGYGTAVADSRPLAMFDVEYPQQSSRGLIFISWWLLVIPHFVVLYVLNAVAGIINFIAWFAILFTGKYPRGMYDFMVGYMRWIGNVSAYVLFMRDEYPPFSLEPGRYPVHFSIDYPGNLSRGLIFIKWLLVFPHLIVLSLVGMAALVCWFIAWWAILFTGRYPPGMFNFLVGVLRWSLRVNTYTYLMTDRYPPFSTAPNPA